MGRRCSWLEIFQHTAQCSQLLVVAHKLMRRHLDQSMRRTASTGLGPYSCIWHLLQAWYVQKCTGLHATRRTPATSCISSDWHVTVSQLVHQLLTGTQRASHRAQPQQQHPCALLSYLGVPTSSSAVPWAAAVQDHPHRTWQRSSTASQIQHSVKTS